MASNHYVIDQVLIDFLESDMAILVAACDAASKPTISRGYGMRVAADRARVTVFVTRQQSAAVIREAERTGRIAVNATRISDYESYQLKGNQAQLVEPGGQDRQHTDRYIKGLRPEMAKVGITPAQVDNILRSYDFEPLVGIAFTVQEVYCQTPGPGAGKPRKPLT